MCEDSEFVHYFRRMYKNEDMALLESWHLKANFEEEIIANYIMDIFRHTMLLGSPSTRKGTFVKPEGEDTYEFLKSSLEDFERHLSKSNKRLPSFFRGKDAFTYSEKILHNFAGSVANTSSEEERFLGKRHGSAERENSVVAHEMFEKKAESLAIALPFFSVIKNGIS